MLISHILKLQQNFLPSNYVMKLWWELNLFCFIAQICTRFVLTSHTPELKQSISLSSDWLRFALFLIEISLTIQKVIQIFSWAINIYS